MTKKKKESESDSAAAAARCCCSPATLGSLLQPQVSWWQSQPKTRPISSRFRGYLAYPPCCIPFHRRPLLQALQEQPWRLRKSLAAHGFGRREVSQWVKGFQVFQPFPVTIPPRVARSRPSQVSFRVALGASQGAGCIGLGRNAIGSRLNPNYQLASPCFHSLKSQISS